VSEYEKWQERWAQASRDLEELKHQIAEGEIPDATGRTLAKTYREEMAEARRQIALSKPQGAQDSPSANQSKPGSGFWNRGRISVVVILAVTGAALLISVGWFADGEEQTLPEQEFDPSQYSNETMEAVIAANSDHAQINGMRLALAERYFQSGNFSAAFPHYRDVLEQGPSVVEQAEALGRLGWMAWAGSGEIQLALDTLDRALTAIPGHPQNLYFKAIVLWCGAGRTSEAVPLLQQVAEALPAETEVAAELAAARSGERCP
jgi:tetratricopeptide (TPR) repeat protein